MYLSEELSFYTKAMVKDSEGNITEKYVVKTNQTKKPLPKAKAQARLKEQEEKRLAEEEAKKQAEEAAKAEFEAEAPAPAPEEATETPAS